MSHNSTRVLISIPKKFLEMVDIAAESECRNRSELIREALRDYLEKINTK